MKRTIKCLCFMVLILSAALLSACRSPQIFVDVGQIERIEAYSFNETSGTGERIFVVDEAHYDTLIGWFNDCKGIRWNRDYAGTTPLVSITIWLDNDDISVSILSSGEDFEIQGKPEWSDERTSYWARQPEIKQLLEDMSEGEDINELLSDYQKIETE